MDIDFTESRYPLSFRAKDANNLGEHLRLRHSVELIGIKRVGISNFLRFFLYHPKIVSTYINHGEKHLFIPVDLNDLIEREIYPFWILTFKRIVDVVEKGDFSPDLQKEIASLFLESIQTQDHFLTIENIRASLLKIVEADTLPTLFFIRFDRLSEAVTPEFFGNLQGLIDATHQKLCYVFTSFRPLDQIAPVVFPRKSLSGFSHLMYLQPAEKKDMQIILGNLLNRYQLAISQSQQAKVLELAGGHVQYLSAAIIILSENSRSKKPVTDLFSFLHGDERITLQSEEVWESLYAEEQEFLVKILNNKKISKSDEEKYIYSTGILDKKNNFFNPFFYAFVKEHHDHQEEEIEFSKKELLLFTMLEKNINSVCEREDIIETVWPEYEESGVSDWTIDRLVARLRNKLKARENKYAIITIKTRGYKMVRE